VSEKISHLIKMANQIARNLNAAGDEETAAVKVADHLTRFWSPQMRKQIIDYQKTGGDELSSVALRAVIQLGEQ
jgi:formate dehydrogenase subunit delta